jgi:hypothetical protein
MVGVQLREALVILAARADGAGRATIAYYIGGATPGYKVIVEVTASVGPRTAGCSTSFTPVS